MQRFSIARSLRLALVGLTVVLAVVAGLGVASLYSSRQHYENVLARTASLATAAANLQTATIAEAEVLRDARGRTGAAARRSAASAYSALAASAAALARSDATSRRLLAEQVAAEARARRLAALRLPTATAPLAPASILTALQQRQQQLQTAARSQARSDSRRAVILVVVAGLLALLAALALITALVGSMRRPLDELVQATRALAGGDLERRVTTAGPRELQDLGHAFNAMGEEMAAAQRRIEDERRRLAVTVESLGDALLVTEPGSSSIAAVNPRADDLVPELPVGADAQGPDSPLPPLETALERRGGDRAPRPLAGRHRLSAWRGRGRRRVDGARHERARSAGAGQERLRGHGLPRAAQPADLDQGLRRAARPLARRT